MKYLAACLLLAASLWTGPTVANAEGRGPCSGWFSNVQPSMGQARVHHRVEHLIDCAVRIWPVPGGTFYARAIAERESHMWPWAQNPGSLCSGIYQHVLSLWEGRVATFWNPAWFWKMPSAFNARANVIVSIRMVHASGWGPWGG